MLSLIETLLNKHVSPKILQHATYYFRNYIYVFWLSSFQRLSGEKNLSNQFPGERKYKPTHAATIEGIFYFYF